MSWDVVYTAGARQDLRDLYAYIADELCALETASVLNIGQVLFLCAFFRKAGGIISFLSGLFSAGEVARIFPTDEQFIVYLEKVNVRGRMNR